MDARYYELVDRCKTLDQQINDCKRSNSTNRFLNSLITKRRRLHRELDNLQTIYSIGRRLNSLRIRESIHTKFRWLFNTHSFNHLNLNLNLDFNSSSVLKQPTVVQRIKHRSICLLIDTYTQLHCGLGLTYTKLKLYLRLFYFKLLLKSNPNFNYN